MKQWTVIFTITCLLLGEFPLYGSPDAAMCRSVYFEPQRQQECLKTVHWNRDAIRAFNPGTSYDYKLQWTRGATRQSIRQFIGRPYEWEGNSLHGTDCSGLIHRILFNGFTYQDKSAATYYKEAQKISGAITNEPKPGDVFFLDWSPVLGGNSDIDHTGFVDNCGYEGSGRKVCRIVHATGTQENPDKVRESIIVQNPDGKWDYYQDIGWYEKGRSPTDMARGESVKHAENLSFRFANSLKMRGLPTAQEVARQETIGRAGVAAQKTLGGVDLNAPFPLDGRSLGLAGVS
ncbi:C40 family peptidase [Candidatus Woesearchaeota archaeon]|nr:C40 family peptidase [Candidatus Woesearchaeota archaeon]